MPGHVRVLNPIPCFARLRVLLGQWATAWGQQRARVPLPPYTLPGSSCAHHSWPAAQEEFHCGFCPVGGKYLIIFTSHFWGSSFSKNYISEMNHTVGHRHVVPLKSSEPRCSSASLASHLTSPRLRPPAKGYGHTLPSPCNPSALGMALRSGFAA